MASGVWSRLRLRRRPSAASRALSKAWHMAAGRSDGSELPRSFTTSPPPTTRRRLSHRQGEGIAGAGRTFVSLLERGDVKVCAGEVVEKDAGRRGALQRRQSLHVAAAS